MCKLILALKNFAAVGSNKCQNTCKLKRAKATYIVAVIVLMRRAVVNISQSPLDTFRLHSPMDYIQPLVLHRMSSIGGFYIYVLVQVVSLRCCGFLLREKWPVRLTFSLLVWLSENHSCLVDAHNCEEHALAKNYTSCVLFWLLVVVANWYMLLFFEPFLFLDFLKLNISSQWCCYSRCVYLESLVVAIDSCQRLKS